jgi:hypothetical protein
MKLSKFIRNAAIGAAMAVGMVFGAETADSAAVEPVFEVSPDTLTAISAVGLTDLEATKIRTRTCAPIYKSKLRDTQDAAMYFTQEEGQWTHVSNEEVYEQMVIAAEMFDLEQHSAEMAARDSIRASYAKQKVAKKSIQTDYSHVKPAGVKTVPAPAVQSPAATMGRDTLHTVLAQYERGEISSFRDTSPVVGSPYKLPVKSAATTALEALGLSVLALGGFAAAKKMSDKDTTRTR